MVRVRITGLGCCTERMSQLLGLGSSSFVGGSVKLRFHVEEHPRCL